MEGESERPFVASNAAPRTCAKRVGTRLGFPVKFMLRTDGNAGSVVSDARLTMSTENKSGAKTPTDGTLTHWISICLWISFTVTFRAFNKTSAHFGTRMFEPVYVHSRHRVLQSRLPSHLVRAPFDNVGGFASLTRGACQMEHTNRGTRRFARALMPTEPGDHNLRIIDQDWDST